MRDIIVNHRKRYGSNWLTIINEEIQIPWRVLSLEEFLRFNDLRNAGFYTDVELEDEIFLLCVLEPVYTENIDILPAGIISVVAGQIFQLSGPQTPEQLAEDLNVARSLVQDFISSAITVICSVFPGYTPETLYALPYEVFMKRLALAEKRLIELGYIKEPLQVIGPENDSREVRAGPQRELPSEKRKKEILEEKKKELERKLKNLNEQVDDKSKASGGTVITRKQMSTNLETDTGHDLQDKALWQHDAIQGLEFIYPEYFKMMKEGKKITPEVIQATKGKNKEEVEAAHEKYIEKIINGEIKPTAPKLLVADKLEAQATNVQNKKEKAKSKVKVKRR